MARAKRGLRTPPGGGENHQSPEQSKLQTVVAFQEIEISNTLVAHILDVTRKRCKILQPHFKKVQIGNRDRPDAS